MFGANGMVVYRQKRADYQDLAARNRSTAEGKRPLHGQINALQTDPKTIEKEAREQLHYARPGEVVYVAPAPPANPVPRQPMRPRNRRARRRIADIQSPVLV